MRQFVNRTVGLPQIDGADGKASRRTALHKTLGGKTSTGSPHVIIESSATGSREHKPAIRESTEISASAPDDYANDRDRSEQQGMEDSQLDVPPFPLAATLSHDLSDAMFSIPTSVQQTNDGVNAAARVMSQGMADAYKFADNKRFPLETTASNFRVNNWQSQSDIYPETTAGDVTPSAETGDAQYDNINQNRRHAQAVRPDESMRRGQLLDPQLSLQSRPRDLERETSADNGPLQAASTLQVPNTHARKQLDHIVSPSTNLDVQGSKNSVRREFQRNTSPRSRINRGASEMVRGTDPNASLRTRQSSGVVETEQRHLQTNHADPFSFATKDRDTNLIDAERGCEDLSSLSPPTSNSEHLEIYRGWTSDKFLAISSGDLAEGLDISHLEQSLEKLGSYNIRHQTNFFSHLARDQWKEAGNIIIQKFSQLTTSLAQARMRKTELTGAFEERILERNQLVMGQKRRINEAMAEMRSHGQELLARTPKRMKSANKHPHMGEH